jgi:hypothetical protein
MSGLALRALAKQKDQISSHWTLWEWTLRTVASWKSAQTLSGAAARCSPVELWV